MYVMLCIHLKESMQGASQTLVPDGLMELNEENLHAIH